MMTDKPIFQIIADGLDASTDGRGWGAEHETARTLANAAPDLLAALSDVLKVVRDARDDQACDGMSQLGGYIFGDVMSDAIDDAEKAIAKATGALCLQCNGLGADAKSGEVCEPCLGGGEQRHVPDCPATDGFGCRCDDLAEASEGFTCQACGRAEWQCSASPCEAVERDRAL